MIDALYYQFSLPQLYVFLKGWENVLFELKSERGDERSLIENLRTNLLVLGGDAKVHSPCDVSGAVPGIKKRGRRLSAGTICSEGTQKLFNR